MERTSKTGRKIRSETVTVRLDPKLRYLAELAARKQRRTLSSYIEWAIEASLNQVHLDEGEGWSNTQPTSVADVASKLWDVEEADRFAELALRYPDLLTHHEAVMWKVVREYGYFWSGQYDEKTGEFGWTVHAGSLVHERLRSEWLIINAIGRGITDKDSLPKYLRKRPRSASAQPNSDADNVIAQEDLDNLPF